MSDKTSLILKHNLVIKCWKLSVVWLAIKHSLLELLRWESSSKVFWSFANTCRMLHQGVDTAVGRLEVCCSKGDGHSSLSDFFLLFLPAVVFSTHIPFKKKKRDRISGRLQFASSRLVEIFSPAPSASVLAKILAIGLTVLS